MTRKAKFHMDDEDDNVAGDDHYEECEVCHQEYDGNCPISSSECPYEEFKDDDDDDGDSFSDVDDLDALIGKDTEVEKIIDAGTAIPKEDLVDEDPDSESDDSEGTEPVKTIEELEAEAFEAAKKKKRAAKKAAKKSPKKQ